MDQPLVSICIPTRNTQRWVRDAVESALAQTWGRVEVIVIDDGSDDETPAILQSFGSRITTRSTPPRGGNSARNLALFLAKGEWIQFLDADDYLLPKKIEWQFSESDGGRDLDVIWSPEWIQRWAGKLELEPQPKPSPVGTDFIEQWLRWELPGTQGGLWRKEALSRIGNWNEAMPCCQDYELYARALRQGLAMQWTATPGSVYRIWSEETVCRRDPVQLILVKSKLIRDMAAFLREQGRWNERYARAAGQICFEMGRTLARENLAQAEEFHETCRAQGLICLEGAAAPWTYRVCYRLWGFGAAERLARLLR